MEKKKHVYSYRRIEFKKEHANKEKFLRVHCYGVTSNACSIP